MSEQHLYLAEELGTRLCSVLVQHVGDQFEGTFDVSMLPTEFRALLAEFEEIVEGQMFSLLDDIEGRIRLARLQIASEDGTRTPISNLQAFPSTGAISFRSTLPSSTMLNGRVSVAPATTTRV
jgi:hypothetical protein